jgi:hypothetical protein
MINYDYFIFTFCAFFPLFISNTSIVSINFGANLDAQNAGKDIYGIQISKIFWGSTPPDLPPPIHAWYIGHTRGLQPLLSQPRSQALVAIPPLIYYLTERSLFKKCPPTGKSLKKALE